MNIIYDSTYTDATLPSQVVLSVGESVEYIHSSTVTAWALIGTTGLARIQASDDDFSSFTYDSGDISFSDTYFLSISSITAAKWRILAGTGGITFRLLYLGVGSSVSKPGYGFSFEKDFIADDRITLGGVRRSIQRYSKKRGSWSFRNINLADAIEWRSIYDSTNGFRIPFIVDIASDINLIIAPKNTLNLIETAHQVFDFSLSAEEVI